MILVMLPPDPAPRSWRTVSTERSPRRGVTVRGYLSSSTGSNSPPSWRSARPPGRGRGFMSGGDHHRRPLRPVRAQVVRLPPGPAHRATRTAVHLDCAHLWIIVWKYPVNGIFVGPTAPCRRPGNRGFPAAPRAVPVAAPTGAVSGGCGGFPGRTYAVSLERTSTVDAPRAPDVCAEQPTPGEDTGWTTSRTYWPPCGRRWSRS